jgi:uncharacterized protein YoxC
MVLADAKPDHQSEHGLLQEFEGVISDIGIAVAKTAVGPELARVARQWQKDLEAVAGRLEQVSGAIRSALETIPGVYRDVETTTLEFDRRSTAYIEELATLMSDAVQRIEAVLASGDVITAMAEVQRVFAEMHGGSERIMSAASAIDRSSSCMEGLFTQFDQTLSENVSLVAEAASNAAEASRGVTESLVVLEGSIKGLSGVSREILKTSQTAVSGSQDAAGRLGDVSDKVTALSDALAKLTGMAADRFSSISDALSKNAKHLAEVGGQAGRIAACLDRHESSSTARVAELERQIRALEQRADAQHLQVQALASKTTELVEAESASLADDLRRCTRTIAAYAWVIILGGLLSLGCAGWILWPMIQNRL